MFPDDQEVVDEVLRERRERREKLQAEEDAKDKPGPWREREMAYHQAIVDMLAENAEKRNRERERYSAEEQRYRDFIDAPTDEEPAEQSE